MDVHWQKRKLESREYSDMMIGAFVTILAGLLSFCARRREMIFRFFFLSFSRRVELNGFCACTCVITSREYNYYSSFWIE